MHVKTFLKTRFFLFTTNVYYIHSNFLNNYKNFSEKLNFSYTELKEGKPEGNEERPDMMPSIKM